MSGALSEVRVTLAPAVARRLRAEAAQRGTSVSALVRSAVCATLGVEHPPLARTGVRIYATDAQKRERDARAARDRYRSEAARRSGLTVAEWLEGKEARHAEQFAGVRKQAGTEPRHQDSPDMPTVPLVPTVPAEAPTAPVEGVRLVRAFSRSRCCSCCAEAGVSRCTAFGWEIGLGLETVCAAWRAAQ